MKKNTESTPPATEPLKTESNNLTLPDEWLAYKIELGETKLDVDVFESRLPSGRIHLLTFVRDKDQLRHINSETYTT